MVDANSGFEPLTFDELIGMETDLTRSGIAFDTTHESPQVRRMMSVLRGRGANVFMLIGNEPIARCYEERESD